MMSVVKSRAMSDRGAIVGKKTRWKKSCLRMAMKKPLVKMAAPNGMPRNTATDCFPNQ